MTDRVRRAILKDALSFLVPALGTVGASATNTTPSADEWFYKLRKKPGLARSKNLGQPLILFRFKDPTYVIRTRGIAWWADQNSQAQHKRVDVPYGFVTDFASIPQVFWSLFKPDGDYAYAAVIHDYLYWVQDRPKEEADAIFRIVMEELKVTNFQLKTLYHAVDLFGQDSWNANRKRREKGERRVITKLPNDVKISWAEWRSRRDIF